MTEKSDNTDDESGPIGGERLRAARRANDISIRDVAKELHLDEPKVRALERNEFDVLGAPVFAKGHLRKYAELVGVAVDDVMADYYQMNRSVGAPPVVGPKRKMPRDISVGPWVGGLAVVVLIAGGAYWWFTRDTVTPISQAGPATLAPFSGTPAETENTDEDGIVATPVQEDAGDAAPVAAREIAEESASQAGAQSVAPPPAENSPAPGVNREPQAVTEVPAESLLPQVEIQLTYSGDCWTEVSDASGRRLFYDLGRAGRVITLAGDAPLRVVLGDSGNVSVSVDGDDFIIPATARSGRLARLTLNKP